MSNLFKQQNESSTVINILCDKKCMFDFKYCLNAVGTNQE